MFDHSVHIGKKGRGIRNLVEHIQRVYDIGRMVGNLLSVIAKQDRNDIVKLVFADSLPDDINGHWIDIRRINPPIRTCQLGCAPYIAAWTTTIVNYNVSFFDAKIVQSLFRAVEQIHQPERPNH
ncbi:MAG: hypothetical protein R6X08_12485 [Desulfosalsimonadaceae bacterium]